MRDLDKVELLDLDDDGSINGIEWGGTWKEFVDDNIDAGMEREEIEEVTGYLDRREMYIFGGAGERIGLRLSGWSLESVGTYMRTDGWCFPMTIDGGYDDDEGVTHHIRDVDPEDDGYEWWQSLSDDDRKIVEREARRYE